MGSGRSIPIWRKRQINVFRFVTFGVFFYFDSYFFPRFRFLLFLVRESNRIHWNQTKIVSKNKDTITSQQQNGEEAKRKICSCFYALTTLIQINFMRGNKLIIFIAFHLELFFCLEMKTKRKFNFSVYLQIDFRYLFGFLLTYMCVV